MNDRESQIRSEIKFLISVFNKMHPDAKNYDDMALYDDFKSQYERVLELLSELECIKLGNHFSKENYENTKLLKSVFKDKDLSNVYYISSNNFKYYSLKVLYDKKNNLMQLLSKMKISDERKKEVKDAINSVFGEYIKDQKKRASRREPRQKQTNTNNPTKRKRKRRDNDERI